MKLQLGTDVCISGMLIGRQDLNFMEKGLAWCLSVSGADPFLRSCQLLGYSKNCTPFVEHEGLILHLQEPIATLYPEPEVSVPHSRTMFLKDPL